MKNCFAETIHEVDLMKNFKKALLVIATVFVLLMALNGCGGKKTILKLF